MWTIDSAIAAAEDMMQAANHKEPSVFLCVAAVILSGNNALDRNALQVDVLRPYATHPQDLPDTGAGMQALIATCGWRPPTMQAKAIATLAHSDMSQYAWVAVKPSSLREWVTWRRRVVLTFKGVSWKTASFAALLLWPFDSPFGIVDRHIVRHYGRDQWYAEHISGKPSSLHAKMPADYRRYRALERLENVDRYHDGASVNLGLYHWYLWESARLQGRHPTPDGSHRALCVYNY